MNFGYSISLPSSNPFIDFYNFNSIQIMFSKSNLSSSDISFINKLLSKFSFKIIHASYHINIASNLILSNHRLYNIHLENLLSEIYLALKLKFNFIIIHMGKSLDLHKDIAYNNMIKFTIHLFSILSKNTLFINSNLKILFETPAGQGSELCSNLKHFINFILTFKNLPFYSNIGVCIDTCHIFQAGVNINNSSIISKTHKLLNKIFHKIYVIHLNNSLHKFNSKLDRHANINNPNAFIKINNLIKFIKPFNQKIFILETNPPFLPQKNIFI
jgi:deoxyribonuclease-4